MRWSCTRLPPCFARSYSCVFPRWFVQTDFPLPAFDFERAAIDEVTSRGARMHGVLGHEHARNAFSEAFDAAREIHRIADRGVLALVIRADEADHRGAGVQSDPDVEHFAELAQLELESLQRACHL